MVCRRGLGKRFSRPEHLWMLGIDVVLAKGDDPPGASWTALPGLLGESTIFYGEFYS